MMWHLSCKSLLGWNQCSFSHLFYKHNELTTKIISECGRIEIVEDHRNYSHKQIKRITFWVFLLPLTSHLPPKTLINLYSKPYYLQLCESVGLPSSQ
jgi:hypothetical protein